MKKILSVLLVISFVLSAAGCAVNIYGRRKSDVSKIGELSDEVARLEALRQKDLLKLAEIEEALAQKLRGEKDVRLEMAERGLVITFVDKILFDSGKADIKEDGLPVLQKVADVLKKKARDRKIGVEGHTDNEPITHSGWKSNWELSTARATSVLHYLVDNGRISPKMLSATGYGEHKPVASNITKDGRRENRRVEIILLPKEFKKVGLSSRIEAYNTK